MKSKLIMGGLLFCSMLTNAQNPKWIIGGANIFDTETKTATSITADKGVSNGYFDNQGNLMFGFSATTSGYSKIIPTQSFNPWGTSDYDEEIIIFPTPGECNSFFYPNTRFISDGSAYHGIQMLNKVIYDETTGNVVQTVFNGLSSVGNTAFPAFIGMAVSKEYQDQGEARRNVYTISRYLYDAGTIYPKLEKYVLNNEGVISQIEISRNIATISTPISELELSPDQAYLSWCQSDRLYFYNLSTDLIVYHTASSTINGVEFDENTQQLFYTCSTGIKKITYSATGLGSSATLISGTSAYGKSQIEQALDGNMYVLKGNGVANSTTLGYLAPNATSVTDIALPNAVKPLVSSLYPLVDQIDGEDYSAYVPGCVNDAVFNDQGTSVPVYVTVNNSIELSGNTTVNVLTDHVAGNEILLKPGVTVESYTARIGACEKASCATSLPSFRGSGQQEANATILEPIVLSTEVVDLLGHKVFEKSGQLEMRELNQLKSGVYIIREKTSLGIESRREFVQ